MVFEELCLPLRGELVNYAKKLTRGDVQRAEDIVHDALIRAWRAWDKWRAIDGTNPRQYARGWLYRIVANTFANDHRDCILKRRTAGWYANMLEDELPGQEPEPEQPGDEVEAALASLIPEFREVIERFYFQDQSINQIVLETGAKYGTVLSRLSRARALLVPRLSNYAREQWGLDGTGQNANLAESTEAPESDSAGVESVVTEFQARAL